MNIILGWKKDAEEHGLLLVKDVHYVADGCSFSNIHGGYCQGTGREDWITWVSGDHVSGHAAPGCEAMYWTESRSLIPVLAASSTSTMPMQAQVHECIRLKITALW